MASARSTVWRLAFAAALTVHVVLLYWPRVEIAGLPQDSDKVAHLLLFAVPAYLGVIAFRHWWPVLLLALHAPVTELVQANWLPARSGAPADAVADFAGVALGVVLALLTRRTRDRAAQDTSKCSEDVTIPK